MKAPKGFGTTYFSLVAIQAYASFIRLLQNITRIEHIAPECPIYIYSAISPPENTLVSFFTTQDIFQGNVCLNQPYHSSLLPHLLPH